MAERPHFDLPFRYVGGAAAVNEQDSLADISACVTAVCLARPGDILDEMDFGLDDPTFDQQPINPELLQRQILHQEPRATLLVETSISSLDTAIANANILVEG